MKWKVQERIKRHKSQTGPQGIIPTLVFIRYIAGSNQKPSLSQKLIQVNKAKPEHGINVTKVTNVNAKYCREAHSVREWKCRKFLLMAVQKVRQNEIQSFN